MRITLKPDSWYAAEFLGKEFGSAIRSYSPIKVFRVVPEDAGNRCFTLLFYHANYPEGVRHKTYRMRMIERNDVFLLAVSIEHSPKRYLLVYPITSEWLEAHFPVAVDSACSIEEWLERNA